MAFLHGSSCRQALGAGAALVLLGCALGMAQAQPTASAPPASAASASARALESEHTAHIRFTHMQNLRARMAPPPEALREQCRFESEISTLPPAGTVALSFDDGPEPGATEHILAVLAKHQVGATFFLIGEKAKAHPELVARILAQPGARVGGHSWSHPNFHHLSAAAQALEIERGDAALASVWLAPVVPVAAAASAVAVTAESPSNGAAPAQPVATAATRKLFRYPYGNASCEANAVLRERGYRIVGWHVDSCDWAFDGDGAVTPHEALSCGVMAPFRRDFLGHVVAAVRARRGGIVLLHEIHRNTVQQLDSLVQRLKDEGFRFVAADDPAYASDLR